MTTLNWPGFGLASISPTLDQPSQSNSSAWTGTRTVITTPWHGKWSFKVTLATRQGDAAFQAARAFFTSLKGQINTFHLPAVEAPQNGNTGVTLSANAAQGATSLALTGVTTALVAGNMVTIAGQLLSLSSVAALSGSAQTVTFMPALRAAASAGASVETAKPYALVYSDSSFTWDIGSWRRYGLSFNATEAVGETDGADPALDIWTGGTGGSGGGGTVFSFPQLASIISRSLLAAITSPSDKQVAYLTEAGREGEFVFSTANLSTQVTADTGQGIYVPPAADTTGATGAWVRKFSGAHNAKWFGAKCDAAADGSTGTDDAAAVQAAITYLAFLGGGDLLIPAHTKCASSLNLDSLHNVRLIGPAGQGAGASTPPPAQLIYTGTGSGRFISAQHATGISIRELGIRYTSASFTGDLIAFTNTTGGSDAAYALVERCLVGGIVVNTARSCISLEGAILCSIIDNHIQKAVVGVRGRKDNGGGSILYSNAIVITRNTFDNLTTSALLNAGEGWTVIGNWFEGTNDGTSGGMPRAYFDNLASTGTPITSAFTYIGNWHGDAVAVTDAWFCNGTTGFRGLEISGGIFATGGSTVPGVKLTGASEGIKITGADFSGAIDLGSQSHVGVTLSGNFFGAEIANHASVIDLWAFANRLNGGWAKSIIRAGNVTEFGIGPQGGGSVTQATNRATAVTLNKLHGQIVLASGAGTTTWNSFVVNNSLVKAIDVVEVCQQNDGSSDAYHCFARPFGSVPTGGFTVFFQTTGGTTTETILFNFRVHSGSSA